MCSPLAVSLISGALSFGGGLIQQSTQNKAITAQNRANQDAVLASQLAADQERLRQRRFEDESTASLSRALEGSAETAEGTGREAETRTLLDEANERVRPGLTVSALPGQLSGDTELAQIIAGEINKSASRVGTQVKGLNTLAGLQSGFGSLSDLFSGTGSAIQTTNLNRRASLDVSGLETSIPAGKVTPGSGLFGDLLTLAGQGLGTFGPGVLASGPNQLNALQRGINSLSGPAPIFSPTPVPRLPF